MYMMIHKLHPQSMLVYRFCNSYGGHGRCGILKPVEWTRLK